MKQFLAEVRHRPGDWVFLPIFFAGIMLADGWLVFAAFVVGAVVNATFGARCEAHQSRACLELGCRK